MPANLYPYAFSPSGELTAVGLGRETTFGSAATPTVWMIADEATFTPTNELLDRPGARMRIGRTESVAGMFTGKGTLSCEADPDNLEAMLMFGMGLDAQSDSGFGTTGTPNFQSPISNPGTNGSVTTTLAFQSYAGSSLLQVASGTGINVGSLLKIDTSGNAETVQVFAKSGGTQLSARTTLNHAAGATVVSATPVVNAHLRALQMSSPRPTFTAQVFRVTDQINYVGCKVSSFSIAPSEKAILSCKAQFEYQSEASLGGYSTYDIPPNWPSAPTPTFSTLQPFTFQAGGNYGKINGVQSAATIMGWQIDVNNGVVADYPNFGGGRLRNIYPEGQTKVSGSLNLGFENQDAYRLFWGGAQASGPQVVVLPLVLALNFTQTWQINATYAYQLTLVMAKAKISSIGVPIKGSDYLKQAVKFESYESSNGAQDDCLIFLVNQNASTGNYGGF